MVNYSHKYLSLLILIIIGLLLRLDFLFAGNFGIDADEAIVGLMAKHIQEGKGIPTFYYGQHYMGSLEPLLTGIVFFFTGVSAVALKCVPLLFSLLLIALIYFLGTELGGKSVGFLSALFVAIPSSPLLVWSAKARGGFVELLVIGTLALLLTVKEWKRETLRWQSIFLISALCGVGWWVNTQILYFILPIDFLFFVALLRRDMQWSPNRLMGILVGFIGFVVGSLPYWIYNIRKDFVSFGMFRWADSESISDHVTGFFSSALPILLGGKRFWHNQELFSYSTLVVYMVFGGVFLFFLWFRKKQILELFLLRLDRKEPIELLFIFLLGTSLIFMLSSFGYLYDAPRYLLPLYVPIPILVAFVIRELSMKKRGLAVLLTTGVVVLHLASSYLHERAIPGEPFVFKGERVSRDHNDLIEWLEKENIQWVRTNYWIGYRLAFETNERVRFLVFQKPYTVRITEYEKEGQIVPVKNVPLVLVPAQARIVEKALKVLGYSYNQKNISGYIVIHDIKGCFNNLTVVAPGMLEVSASENTKSARNAVDGSLETRWGTAMPQHSGMQFQVNVSEPRILKALEYDLGNWIHDDPRSLSIELAHEGGTPQTLLSLEDYRAVRYYLEMSSSVKMCFTPTVTRGIRFSQHGVDPVFDWSMAEIRLYE